MDLQVGEHAALVRHISVFQGTRNYGSKYNVICLQCNITTEVSEKNNENLSWYFAFGPKIKPGTFPTQAWAVYMYTLRYSAVHWKTSNTLRYVAS
jgi:hypothetical protein